MQTPGPFVRPRAYRGCSDGGSPRPAALFSPASPGPQWGGPAQGRACLALGSTAHPPAPDFRAPSSRGQQRPWALLRISSEIREHLFSFVFLSTSLSSCLCENESYCLFKRAICLRPLEFICWRVFHVHVQFRPWLQSRGYVTWDGMNPIGIWGPPVRPALGAAGGGEMLEGELAAGRMQSGGGSGRSGLNS